MSALFPVPHPAHLGNGPVLWFGVVVFQADQNGPAVAKAIVAGVNGNLMLINIADVTADLRHVTERAGIVPGEAGPGWADLEDIEAVQKDPATALAQAVTEGIIDLGPNATPEDAKGTDGVITDREGNRYDAESGLPLDS